MNYNFDEIIDRRHTNALNTDGFRGYIFHAGPEKVFAFKDEEFVRMWVADMEFGVAPEILDALRARIDRRIFGYTGLYDDEYYHTFSNWCKDHYDWHFPKEQLCISPGIIPALYQLTEMLCTAGEKVLLNTPAYGYFLHAAEYAGVDVLTSPLHKKADGTFEVDYEDFERKCADPACKLVFWCNPHNPTGRMWTEDELRRVAAIIEKYNLWVVSDEIHCDLTKPGKDYVPFASVSETCRENSITCVAPTKTFNLAGLQTAAVIVPNPVLRHRVNRGFNTDEVAEPNVFAAIAPVAAFNHGAEWLDSLREYLWENRRYAEEFITKEIKGIHAVRGEATYLLWLDCREVTDDATRFYAFIRQHSGLYVCDGNEYKNGQSFLRVNLACPKDTVIDGLNRLKDSTQAYLEQKNKAE